LFFLLLASTTVVTLFSENNPRTKMNCQSLKTFLNETWQALWKTLCALWEQMKSLPSPINDTVWHKLIPSIAIAFQSGAEGILNLVFRGPTTTDSTTGVINGPQCTGNPELVWRTITFVCAFILGMLTMKYEFTTEESGATRRSVDSKKRRFLLHLVINFAVVLCWLFAISDFPLTCWIDSDNALTEKETRTVDWVRTGLLVLAQMFVALEGMKPDLVFGPMAESDAPPAKNTMCSSCQRPL
jgi:hypothetical protein